MNRNEIINTIGSSFLTSNLENGEFSYPKAYKEIGKVFPQKSDETTHSYLDIRFVKDNVSILVETKNNFDKWNMEEVCRQLQAYVDYEKEVTGNKTIAILANTEDDRLKVWWGTDLKIDDSHQLKNQYSLKTFLEYSEIYSATKNDKEQVIKSTYKLNELLHKHGITENIRSQFVGTCLLALKNGTKYKGLTTKQIIGGLEEVVTDLLGNDINKIVKLAILKTKVLDAQVIRSLSTEGLQEILSYIELWILPYINEKSSLGQDILNLFFTTFNKYVGKADKNQAFTPDHIVSFMCQVLGVNRNSRVLDPCSGSGAFLVRAMTDAINDCANEKEIERVKKSQIYGIEFEETAFGLSTTNMLIHGDGNSNILQGSCFDLKDKIEQAQINIVLMNPPYNAQRRYCNPDYVKSWAVTTKEDPSQGFHFVHYIASVVKTGKLAVLLPMQCAIGSSTEIQKFKTLMLQDHTLDAVFSLPPDIFHPGASASACCMVFQLGVRHINSYQDTFFGYFKEDGFTKKKNLGRVEKTKQCTNEGVWADIESLWIDTYRKRSSLPGLSVTKRVTDTDEWLAEAYMQTDYSSLDREDFAITLREFNSYLIKYQNKIVGPKVKNDIFTQSWKWFAISNIFSSIESCRCQNASELEDGEDIYYVGAKKTDNGIMKSVKRIESLVTKGNCIVFICDGQGSVGYSNYMDEDFIGSTTLSAGYFHRLNKYIGLFLVAILDMERPKYSFGRKYRRGLDSTQIKLPATESGDPDWDFMENYIKSLPYGSEI